MLDLFSALFSSQFHDTKKNNQGKAIQLLHVFAPMLCKRPTRKLEDTVREMGGSDFYIEEKLDGERMQLHKHGGEYFYGSRPVHRGIFLVLPISDPRSRKGKDYTYLYGKHAGTGSLTPHIDKAFDSRVDECVPSLSQLPRPLNVNVDLVSSLMGRCLFGTLLRNVISRLEHSKLLR